MTLFNDVREFHEKLGLPNTGEWVVPHLLTDEAFRYRLACLNEEIRELTEAHAVQNLACFADALADIVWFALGTAQLAHLPFDGVWAEVRQANMEKRRWVEGDPLKPRNGTSLEVVKPPGWKSPNLNTVLGDRIRLVRNMQP